MRLGLVVTASVATLVFAGCGDLNPASLEYVGVTPGEPRIGEIAVLQFAARDNSGGPMAGVEVTFSLEGDPAGVELLNARAMTDRDDGIAETQVVATARVASVIVRATAGNKTVYSSSVSFAGATAPNGTQFTFQCGEVAGPGSGGVHAIGAFDSTRSLIAGVKLLCNAHVADRNGDGIPGATISFLTEAGTIGPSATSVSDVVGNAQVLYKTSYPLPVDTQPDTFQWRPVKDATHTGEFLAPLWMNPFAWADDPVWNYTAAGTGVEPSRTDPIRGTSFCPTSETNCVNNPRDNLVTLIAVTTGEEGFWDENNNGQYDTGEPFEDLTEPFVDADDDGTHDESERFVDTNGNGRWDGKNGSHDANTLIWVPERILWTGIPHGWDWTTTTDTALRIIAGGAIGHGGTQPWVVAFSDPWFNGIASNGSDDGCSLADSDRPVVKLVPSRLGGGAPSGGFAYAYSSATVLRFEIEDAHDLYKTPPDPAFPSARVFRIPMWCDFTAAPGDGQRTTVAFSIEGTVL